MGEKEFKKKEYKKIQVLIKYADNEKQKYIDEENRIKYYGPELKSSFPDEEKVKRYIRSRKGIAFKPNYIIYICDLYKMYGANQKMLLKADMKECIKKQMQVLPMQGIQVQDSKLTEEEDKMYQEAKKFF